MSHDLVILDTNFLIDYLAGIKSARLKLIELYISIKHLATTVINVSELYRGLKRRKWGEKRIKQLEGILENLTVVVYEKQTAKHIGELLAELDDRGDPIGFEDAAIAGMCIEKNAPLVTRNVKHFSKVPECKVISY
ncbi:MAG: type II toxin-antitoxin system VapC family toxin [Promethearchaeota archaeon]